MEKLELKHLAPYLPYGLKIKLESELFPTPEVVGIVRDTIWLNYHGKGLSILVCNAKPILRPLSDLTKEINFKNNVFIPVEYFEIGDDDSGTEYTSGNIKTIEQLIDISKYNSFHDIHYIPFALVQQLLEWHFDIYGLIDKGLAISYSDVHSTSNEG